MRGKKGYSDLGTFQLTNQEIPITLTRILMTTQITIITSCDHTHTHQKGHLTHATLAKGRRLFLWFPILAHQPFGAERAKE